MADPLDKIAGEVKSIEDEFSAERIAFENADTKGLTVSQLAMLITQYKLALSKNEHTKKMKEYQDILQEVTDFKKVLQLINIKSDTDGLTIEEKSSAQDVKVDENSVENLYTVLENFKKKYPDCKIDLKTKYDAHQRDKLVQNINQSKSDRELKLNFTLEGLQQATNERYELYQYARSINKTFHDAGLQVLRNIAK